MLDGGLVPSLVATFHTMLDGWTKRCVLCRHKGARHRQGFDSSACKVAGCPCPQLEYPGEDARITEEIRAQLGYLGSAELREIAAGAAREGRPRTAARFARVASQLEALGM